jgi:tetratricopeptide (TPR) repeat protein
VCDVYYAASNFAGTKTITEEIVVRAEPPPPWWALNRYGLCQLRLGFPDSALDAFKRALPLASSQTDRGPTPNNLSQVYKARGDYDTALRYLEQSLQICREIGDKAGEGTTLNNLGLIYQARGDYDTALRYSEQSLQLRREIGDKAGEGTTLYNMGSIALEVQQDVEQTLSLCKQAFDIAIEIRDARLLFHTAQVLGKVFAQAGAKDKAKPLLQMAVQVGTQAGFPGVDEIEAVLRQLS